MVATATRFTAKTMSALVDLLLARRVAVAHCAGALRNEAADALSGLDLSDLLDDEDPSGDSDAATALMLVQRAEGRLWEVEEALGRVANGTYGYCIACGAGIPLRRLRALPSTASCVECGRRSSNGARYLGWRQQSRLLAERDRLRRLHEALRLAATSRRDYEPHDVTDDEAAVQADAIECRLTAIDEALERIDSGGYGTCLVCGSGIGDERLEALPAPVLCRSCAG